MLQNGGADGNLYLKNEEFLYITGADGKLSCKTRYFKVFCDLFV